MVDQPADRRRWITAQQAADHAGLSRSGLRTLAGRALLAGVELRAPREQWPSERAPLFDREALDAYLSARPGRGRRAAS